SSAPPPQPLPRPTTIPMIVPNDDSLPPIFPGKTRLFARAIPTPTTVPNQPDMNDPMHHLTKPHPPA
ncbi:27246_t:CDS:1, partial [Racocetra persica]